MTDVNTNQSLVALTREINRVKKQIDEAEWEGQDAKQLKKHLAHLMELEDAGESFYTNF